MIESIYTITVVEVAENEKRVEYKFGCCRCWGFYLTEETARKVLENNETDLHEACYDYGVIERYEPGVPCHGTVIAWYKYNFHEDKYEECIPPEGADLFADWVF